jgi:hypothetical protein
VSTILDRPALERMSRNDVAGLEHPGPAATSRWRLVLDRANPRRPQPRTIAMLDSDELTVEQARLSARSILAACDVAEGFRPSPLSLAQRSHPRLV